ncbi:amidohydrolase family protein [Sinosporangium siamense]|uniref:2-amino-3-carboxymuconate-6-semialdehyde decarboxylase n=1 Tax=Sinosporangium siamense TaxID=1367973 RepID=A0A919RPC6_9ACTN|nr:amidohydrolase family protein [Sinosporangium siamense]GII95709.1 amidohydrolase [Sinosporangium siamense]
MIIDVHSHYVPRGWPDLGWPLGPRLRVDSEREATIMVGDQEFRRIQDDCWNPARRLEQMDADKVDVQVVSPTPVFFAYDRPAMQAAGICRVFNDLALDICTDPRLVPFCQVPLQDADLACAELDRAMAAGHRGVEIGNHVGDQDLDAEGVVQFLQHCAEVGAPVFVHPWDMPDGPRLDRWMARWLVGMPAETHLSVLAMILGGVFDRLPDSLRICFAHGGGSFAFWLGRLENAWHRRSDVIGVSEFPPSHYVNRFSVDSVVFDERALRLLVDVMGEDQVMLGSDFPYPLGESPVGTVIHKAEFLSSTAQAKVLGGNAQRFLALEPSPA